MCDDAVEAKNEEREALVSIYDGDDAFKQIDASTFQYKVSWFITERVRSTFNLNSSEEIERKQITFDFSLAKKATEKHLSLNWNGQTNTRMKRRR